MDTDWVAHAQIAVTTVALVAACVLGQYEGLLLVSRHLERDRSRDRRKVLTGIFCVLGIHVAQIWLFGLAVWLLLMRPESGALSGVESLHLFDAIYFSAVTFTTVGFGDLTPVGPIRFVAGTEALTGFVLITWSASFTFIEMQKFWKGR